MKPILQLLLVSISCILPLAAQEAPKVADPFEDGMRQAFTAYKKGDNEAVTAKLRELLKLMDEKGAAKMGGLLPDMLGTWKGESLKHDDATPGSGISISRTYVSGEHQITIRIVKDSPLVSQLLPLLLNEDLLRMANRKTYRVSGEMAVMEGEEKLQLVVDQRIYVELEGNSGTAEADLVALAEKLDLKSLAKIK
ncbi:MAG: hypothetical protein ABI162_09320 [Luteolibacter sp.]